MTLTPATFADLGSAKARVIGWLDAACRRPGCDLTTINLIGLCLRGQAQLVLVRDAGVPVAVGVTQVRDHASGRRSCWVLALGGRAAGSWRVVIAAIEAGAAAVGCDSVAFVGRRGWARIHPDYVATPCEAGLYFEKRL